MLARVRASSRPYTAVTRHFEFFRNAAACCAPHHPRPAIATPSFPSVVGMERAYLILGVLQGAQASLVLKVLVGGGSGGSPVLEVARCDCGNRASERSTEPFEP